MGSILIGTQSSKGIVTVTLLYATALTSVIEPNDYHNMCFFIISNKKNLTPLWSNIAGDTKGSFRKFVRRYSRQGVPFTYRTQWVVIIGYFLIFSVKNLHLLVCKSYIRYYVHIFVKKIIKLVKDISN